MEEIFEKNCGVPKPQSENFEAKTQPEKELVPTVNVKFNKQVKNLSLDEAKELAQKGLKYEAICEDYNRLKSMAAKSGMSVCEFLSKTENEQKQNRFDELIKETGGNEELSKHIMALEEKEGTDLSDFNELKKEFPEINEIGELPEEVTENSELKGTRLLDEYLRWLLKEKRAAKAAKEKSLEAEASSTGSQKSDSKRESFETSEFLKGLWKR